MSNVGRKFPSEMTSYIDKKSGREIIQLTNGGSNCHFYFTDNSFCTGDKKIIYRHSDKSLSEGGVMDFYSLDLVTGERTQLTDFASASGRYDNIGSATKSKSGDMIVCIKGGDLYAIFPRSGEERLLARCPVGFTLCAPSISYDERYVVCCANSIPNVKKTYSHENYGGFKENFYAHKVGRLILANVDGSGAECIFEDTHWMGHTQFSPDSNEFLTYCHEGPWNYVQERIWIFNTITRHVIPCYSQKEEDSLGHEFWTGDGLIFYDNRGPGHDGTITSDKTQAVTVTHDGPDAIPKVGFVDRFGKLLREIELPYYCNHYHANNDNTKLVADAVNDLVLIDISGDKPSLEVLCEHNTSWRWQGVHCHPTWSWSNDAILFASDKDKEGYPQLYLIKM